MPLPDTTSAQNIVRLFADGEIAAVPTLEVVARCHRDDLPTLYNRLWVVIEQHGLLLADAGTNFILINDRQIEPDFELLTDAALSSVKEMFYQASSAALRIRPVTLQIIGRPGSTLALSFANTFRLTLGSNFFPDDLCNVSLNVTATRADAWQLLASLRDALLPLLGQSLCWSTLGYGFVFDYDRLTSASEQMEFLCMRYLGVDLIDLFGTRTFAVSSGMRSINWQVCASPQWLAMRNPEQAEKLCSSGLPYLNHLFWQTGEFPSVCDRNSETDHAAIVEYAKLDCQLSGAIFAPSWLGFPRWSAAEERWPMRWHEFKC